MKLRFVPFLLALFLIGMVFPATSPAQMDRANIDKSRIPLEADNVNSFVPPGWKLEEQVSGDLNGDSLPDYALKLIEDKPAKTGDDSHESLERVLVIVLKNRDGKLSRAATADRLLQCTGCGGAFYGVMPAPANVRIQKGVLIVNQDHGSRNVVEATYRFRYEPDTKKFRFIGFDVVDTDRATGEVVTKSTNYLTAVEVTVRSRTGRRGKTTSRKSISKEKIYIEQVDMEQIYDEQ